MPAAKKTTSQNRVTKTGDVVIPSEKVTELVDPKPEPVKRVGRPPKVKKIIMTIMTNHGPVDLGFENQLLCNTAYQQISFKCASGRPAVVMANDKEYTFCNVDYIVREQR
tara:strand:- start:2722 stop:3051 length:330 start_codon:yes stop_codon:yes gene_type:complete